MNRRTIPWCLAALLLGGCQGAPVDAPSAEDVRSVEFVGESHAGLRLQTDALGVIRALVQTRGCGRIEQVVSEVTHFEPTNGIEGHTWGRETWTVKGCDTAYRYRVGFSEDGHGGTLFRVTPLAP